MEKLTTILTLIFGFVTTIGTICSILYLLIKSLSKEIKDVKTEIKRINGQILNYKKYNDILRNVEILNRQHQEHLTYFHKISNKK